MKLEDEEARHGAENGVARHGAEDEEVAIVKNRHKVGEDRKHKFKGDWAQRRLSWRSIEAVTQHKFKSD